MQYISDNQVVEKIEQMLNEDKPEEAAIAYSQSKDWVRGIYNRTVKMSTGAEEQLRDAIMTYENTIPKDVNPNEGFAICQ